MTKLDRRTFLKATGVAAAAGVAGMPTVVLGASKKVVVVGGGAGGATCARYLKIFDPGIEVTLIEPKKHFHTCFMSNEVIAGKRSIESIRFGYDGLKKMGINVVHDLATAIDPDKKVVKTAGGLEFPYERCVLSPGIDFRFDVIEGFNEELTKEQFPHAWKAGEQTLLLRKQLEAFEDGGTLIVCPPGGLFRCPPGPYERISLIAEYFKKHKPKSKIIVLDPKAKFSKFGLFMDAWKRFYGYGTDNAMIEWHSGDQDSGVVKLDVSTMTVTTAFGDKYKGDMIHIIPYQKAGHIAEQTGLMKGGEGMYSWWCPVDTRTMESTKQKNIHVLGDAAIAASMPKSGYAANSQAKVCAAAIAALLNGQEPPVPAFINTCYSIAADKWGFSVMGVYKSAKDGSEIVKLAGGTSPVKSPPEYFEREEQYAHSWYNNITKDMFNL